MASSSTSASYSRSCKYDVFLSFRGGDTRKTFVDHLHSALEQHLINVYKDDETLPRGESIDQSLFEAIEESQIAVIIFSKNYADSSWCLEELAHIMKCKVERGLIVMPIFYDVEPTDVRNQKRKFGEAFAKQEAKNVTKAEIWRKSLVDVSNITGWELKNIANGHETKFIKIVVDTILDRLFVLTSCVDEDLVGMRDRFQKLKSLLDIESGGVRMVGIWGVGGCGKTTLAASFCMKISQNFQGYCIVENVREETRKHGLNKLQQNILSVLFQKEVKVHSVVEGKHMMKSMLCRRKVLVLLDDVDKLDQLEALAGKHNWFGSGSRIIITTRDEHLLKTHKVVNIYRVTLLSEDEAIRLFKIHAYNEEDPIEDYKTLSLRVVSYASGLPLSLKVLGCFLYDKNKNEWISALEKLKDIPNPEVMNILKISYDGLEPYEKELFLDIACFWRREPLSKAMEVLEACGFHPEIGIKVLRQKALITIFDEEDVSLGAKFDMHDVLQDMGHHIVRGEYPNNPEKHSRVWKHEDIKRLCFGNAITENSTIEVIKFGDIDALNLVKFVSKMKKLRWLSVSTLCQEGPSYLSNELQYIDWSYYPTSFFPGTFIPKKLVFLKLEHGMLKELWKGDQELPHLKVLELSYMKELLSMPDFNGLPHLQKLTLVFCTKLEEFHPSLGKLTSLEYLRVFSCTKLRRLPTISQVKTIKTLLLTGCHLKDGDMPGGIGELFNLENLNLSGNSFSRLDFSFQKLTRLKILNLSYCKKLLQLPEPPSSLAILNVHRCKSLRTVEDYNKNHNQLRQASFPHHWSDKLLQLMLKGKDIKNGFYLQLEGLDMAKRFQPCLRRRSCRLELQPNWCNDFSGFLFCFVIPNLYSMTRPISISIKHLSGGTDYEEDMFWEESDGDSDKHTFMWYVSFGSLRDTTWWDQTYNTVCFKIESPFYMRGFGVRLVEKESRSGLIETSTGSSHYTPMFEIVHDSASALEVSIDPFKHVKNENGTSMIHFSLLHLDRAQCWRSSHSASSNHGSD